MIVGLSCMIVELNFLFIKLIKLKKINTQLYIYIYVYIWKSKPNKSSYYIYIKN